MNYATSIAGGIQVEIQDLDARTLPGFALRNCRKMVGDSIDETVAWSGNVGELAGQPVRLRFVVTDADVYSFHFAKHCNEQ